MTAGERARQGEGADGDRGGADEADGAVRGQMAGKRE